MEFVRVWGSLIVSLLAFATGGAALYVRTAAAEGDAPQRERIVKLETQIDDMRRDIAEIKGDVKELLKRK